MEILTASKHTKVGTDILDIVPAIISVVNADLRYTYVNKSFLKFHNTEADKVIGKPVPDILGSEIFTTIEPYIKNALKGETACFQLSIESEGKTRYFETNLSPDLTPEGKIRGYTSCVVELSEQTQELIREKEALRVSEERYHRMVEEVKDYAIILLDKEGNIVDWNKGAEKIKGYRSEEIIGQNFRIFYMPEDRQRKLPEQLIHEAETNGKAEYEGWRVKKDGTLFWGSIVITALHGEDGNVIGYSKVTRDLTERKASEEKQLKFTRELQQKNEELRRSEERYHKMISEVEDYAIILLDVNGYIQNWNRGAENIKGYKADEIVGKHFTVFYSPEDREQQLADKLLTEAREKGKATHEGWRLKKDGSKFWGSVVITALHDEERNIIGFSKVTRDLTERKIAEDLLKQNADQLQSQNKELEQFAYVASHDLQEPLRKIRTFNSLIMEHESGNLSAKGKDYFQRSISAADRMHKLIDDLLTYSRATRDVNQMETVDLNQVINRIKTSYRETNQKVAIESDKLPELQGMRFQFEQLFENLISNGVKYQPDGNMPRIQIRYKLVAGNEVSGRDYSASLRFHHIQISDNGIGFEQQYAEKIFEMFHRLHGRSEFSGSGIGLAIVKKIVQNYGGMISAESAPGQGATFNLYFPVEHGVVRAS